MRIIIAGIEGEIRHQGEKRGEGVFQETSHTCSERFLISFFSSLFFIISMHYIISTSLCRTLLCAPAYISHTLCHVVIISFFFFSFLLYTNSHSGPGGRRRIFGIAKYHSGPLRFFSTTCAGEREFL